MIAIATAAIVAFPWPGGIIWTQAMLTVYIEPVYLYSIALSLLAYFTVGHTLPVA